jgi:tRNA 2-thiouridine synthesizing protein A
LQAGLTAPQLADLELAYAPPFGSAKDPVNIAGYVAGNTLDGTHPVRHWHEVADLDHAAVQLLDVRTGAETEAGTLPGALCIPLHTLRERLAELDPAREVLAYCQIGLRGYLACRILAQRGFRARNLSGGYTTWRHATQGQAQEDAAQDEPLAQAFSAAPAPPAPSGG